MQGKKVKLRDEVKDSDLGDLFSWWNLEEWQYCDEPDAAFKPIMKVQFDKLRVEKIEMGKNKSKNWSQAWQIDTLDGCHIGFLTYYQYDDVLERAFVGIGIPEEKNCYNGFGAEAQSFLIDYLFREMNLKEVKTASWTGNKRMVNYAEKCGFSEFKIMPHRDDISVRREPLERIEFTMTRSEWPYKQKG